MIPRRAVPFLAALALAGVAALARSATAADEPAPQPTAADAAAAPAAEEKRPNIVLVTIDTQRADSFGFHGNEKGLTPNIDRLASRGTVFERATSPIGTTLPAHASMLTGLYPRRHGVRYDGDALSDEFQTVAEILGERGWETMALVSYGSMVSRGGLGQGFVRTSHEKTGETSKNAPPSRVSAMAKGLLSRRRPFPFFMWVHYFQPHSPYEPTPYSREQLEGYEGPMADGLSTREFHALPESNWDDDDRKALRALYDGQTRQADEAVGQILATLEKTGLDDRTIVVVTADHGQLLGEHGDVAHDFRLWQEVLHVPLVVFDPRRPEPRRVSTRVGLVDLAPTLLDLAGVPAPDGLDGRSLVPLLGGEELDDRPYYGEVRAIGPKKSMKKRAKDEDAVAVFLGDEKVVVRGGETTFFDLSKDPGEESPLPSDAGDPQRARLEKLAAGHRPAATPAKGQTEPDAPPAETAAEPKALGYLEGD